MSMMLYKSSLSHQASIIDHAVDMISARECRICDNDSATHQTRGTMFSLAHRWRHSKSVQEPVQGNRQLYKMQGRAAMLAVASTRRSSSTRDQKLSVCSQWSIQMIWLGRCVCTTKRGLSLVTPSIHTQFNHAQTNDENTGTIHGRTGSTVHDPDDTRATCDIHNGPVARERQSSKLLWHQTAPLHV